MTHLGIWGLVSAHPWFTAPQALASSFSSPLAAFSSEVLNSFPCALCGSAEVFPFPHVLSPWMVLVVDLLQPLLQDVRVDLRGRNIAVPQH